jgi:FAD:protein FMN transferase
MIGIESMVNRSYGNERVHDFMKRIAIGNVALALMGIIFAWPGVGAAEPNANSLQRYTFSEIHMGAAWKIILYAHNETAANNAAQAAYARIEELNHVLSDYDSNSELSRLTATSPSPQAVPVSDDLWRVLEFAQSLSAKSEGAFDITVGPLSKLWRQARRSKEMPEPSRLEAARQATDYRALRLDPKTRTAQLVKPNMCLDAGGIGMGYAVDEAFKVLRQEGIAAGGSASSHPLAKERRVVTCCCRIMPSRHRAMRIKPLKLMEKDIRTSSIRAPVWA